MGHKNLWRVIVLLPVIATGRLRFLSALRQQVYGSGLRLSPRNNGCSKIATGNRKQFVVGRITLAEGGTDKINEAIQIGTILRSTPLPALF